MVGWRYLTNPGDNGHGSSSVDLLMAGGGLLWGGDNKGSHPARRDILHILALPGRYLGGDIT